MCFCDNKSDFGISVAADKYFTNWNTTEVNKIHPSPRTQRTPLLGVERGEKNEYVFYPRPLIAQRTEAGSLDTDQ